MMQAASIILELEDGPPGGGLTPELMRLIEALAEAAVDEDYPAAQITPEPVA